MNAIRCSYVDQTLKNACLGFAFFYEKSINFSELKQSLTEVLCDYSVFNGRLCSKNGLLYIETKENNTPQINYIDVSHTLIEELEHTRKNESEHLGEMVNIKKSLRGKSPLFTAKVTYFSCGGMCLAISYNHAIGDLHSISMLLQSWAKKINGEPYDIPIIVDDREAFILEKTQTTRKVQPGLRYLNNIDLIKLIYYLSTKGRKKRTLKFYFSEHELSELKKNYTENCKIPISTFDALSAHLFSIIGSLDSHSPSKEISLAVNARARVGIDNDVLGNLINSINIFSNQPHDHYLIAETIRSSLNSYTDKHLDFHANYEFIQSNGGYRKIDRFIPKALDPQNGNLLITNWAKSGFFNATFKGNKLFYFTPIGKVPIPWVSVFTEGINGEGIVFTITLPEQLAHNLTCSNSLQLIHEFRVDKGIPPHTTQNMPWL